MNTIVRTLQRRLHARGRRSCIALWPTQPVCLWRAFQQEERLHAQATGRKTRRLLVLT